MKHLHFFIVLFILLLNAGLTVAQTCGEQYFTTQSQVDDFAATGCKIITGSLILSGSSITHLDSLYKLNQINKTLSISNCDGLSSLHGLHNLTSVGSIYLNNNDNTGFVNLQGLNNLKTIQGELFVWKNDYLESFDGLDSLRDSVQMVKIVENIALTDLSALSKITKVTGEPDKPDGGGFTVKKNNLQSLAGWENLTYIGTFLSVQHEKNIKDFQGLAHLSQVTGQFSIFANDSLESLDGLERLISVGGNMTVSNNPELSKCDAICPLINANGVSNYTVGSNASTGNCNYTLGTYCDLLLPVSLTEFRATQQQGAVLLEWTTESEQNNEGFAVQYSRDGREWSEIGWVKGHGTEAGPHRYEFEHYFAVPGINYYRLAQQDDDGNIEYSAVISILLDGEKSAFAVYPNPAVDKINFFSTQSTPVQIAIYSMQMQKMWEGSATELDISSWSPGWYIAVGIIEGKSYRFRFLKSP